MERPTAPPLLQVRGLSKSFTDATTAQQRLVLADVDFDVGHREVVSLVGPSGSGKTTLLRLIANLEEPSAGVVKWNHSERGKPGIAMLFQDYNRSLFPWLSVQGQLRLALTSQNLDRQTCEERITQALEVTNLSEFRHHLPRELSGGMQQRAALGRALLQEPDILLLDEPFGSVDTFTRMHLEDYVLNLAVRLKLSILLVTHDVEEAVYMADRVITISGTPARVGRVVDVQLPRPRNQQTRVTPEFVALKGAVIDAIQGA